MMMGHNTLAGLADSLGDVRNQIAWLKAREAELRQEILAARPNGAVTGEQFLLEVRHQTRKRFDPKFLPAHIRDDSRYWTMTQTQTVLTRKEAGNPAAERAVAADPAREDEFDMI